MIPKGTKSAAVASPARVTIMAEVRIVCIKRMCKMFKYKRGGESKKWTRTGIEMKY